MRGAGRVARGIGSPSSHPGDERTQQFRFPVEDTPSGSPGFRETPRRGARRKESGAMRTGQDFDLEAAYVAEEPKGMGWVTFAVVMLGVAGIWNFVDGILAVSSSHVYTSNADYVFSDLNTWGWIMMILGIIEGLAALAILSGSEWARWFGIAAAGLNGIGR